MKTFFSTSRIVALSLLAAVGATFAPQAMAQEYYNPGGALIGGLIGGAIGNQAFRGHNRNDRAAATAGLAVVGAMIGSQTGTPYQPQPTYYSGAPTYYSAPVVYGRPPVVYYDSGYSGHGRSHHRYEPRHHYRNW
jgi:uncharacterized protein YcfJ